MKTTKIVAVIDGDEHCTLAEVPDAQAWEYAMAVCVGRRRLYASRHPYWADAREPYYSEADHDVAICVDFSPVPALVLEHEERRAKEDK